MLLFRWNRQALSIPDSLGRLPLSVAHSRGHVRLARCLEELQRQEASSEPPPALSPPSSSPDTGEGLRGMRVEAQARGKLEGGRQCKERGGCRDGEVRAARPGRWRVRRGQVTPYAHTPFSPLAGLSSVSSPSELSDGTFSVTSAYSSAPDGSPPPVPLPASEMTMEMVPGQLSSGAPEAPLFLMDYEATNPRGPPPSPPPLPPALDGGAAPEEADSPPAVDVIPVPLRWRAPSRGGCRAGVTPATTRNMQSRAAVWEEGVIYPHLGTGKVTLCLSFCQSLGFRSHEASEVKILENIFN